MELMEPFITAAFFISILICAIVMIQDIVFAFLHQITAPEQIRFAVKNRAETIEATLRMLSYRNPQAEITVVDYGSEDNTVEIIKKLAADIERIHLEQPAEHT